MKIRFAVCTALFLVATLATAAFSTDTLEEVRKKGVLVAGVTDATPPFGFKDRESGEIVGIEIDLVKAIAKKLGVTPKFVSVEPAGRIPALLDGKVDIVAATMSKTPDRANFVDFSLTYFTTRQRVLAKTGSVSVLKDLEGRKIGTIEGSPSEMHLRTEVPAAVIYPFSDYKFAIDALRKGAIDAVTGDGLILFGILATLPKGAYEIPMGVALSDDSYGLAVRKGDVRFLELVDATLTELNKSGEARKIFESWMARRDGETAPPAGPRAGGVIVRTATPEGRYVALGVRGIFRTDAEVGFYTPQGDLICNGKVLSIYGDEVYVDASCAPKDSIQVGFPIAMNLTPAEAKKIIAERQDVLKNVKADVLKADERRNREISAEYTKEQEDRRKYQEQVTREKMLLDYQYDDRHYYYRW